MSFRLQIVRILSVCAVVAFTSLRADSANGAPYGFPVVASFGAEEMGADPAAYCARQGSDGTLYVGGNGLLTFDGERWKMTAVPGIDGIYGLDFGSDGRLWVAAEGDVGWFSHRDDGKWDFHSLRQEIPADTPIRGQVWSILSEGRDGVAFTTTGRIYRWDGARISSWPIPGVYGAKLFRLHGQIYAQDYRGGLYRLGPGGLSAASAEEFGGPASGSLLWSDGETNRWIVATADAFYLGDEHGATRFPVETARLLLEARVGQIAALPGNRFAFVTRKNGIVITQPDGAIQVALQESDGIPPYVHSLFADRDGLLWILSHVGIQRLDVTSPSRVFDSRADIPAWLYRSVGVAGNTVVIGTVEGGLVLNADRQHFSKLDIKQGVHVLTDTSDGLLVGSEVGVWRQNGAQTELLQKLIRTPQTGEPSRFHPGEVLVASYDMTVVSLGAHHEPRRVVENLPVVGASLAEDNDGNLWIGTDTHGLFVARPAKSGTVTATHPAATFGLPEFAGPAYVRVAPNGDLIVATDAGGWVKLHDQSTFVPIRDFPARPLAAISRVIADGSLWIAHAGTNTSAASVARISPEGGWHWSPHSVAELDSIGPLRGLAAAIDDSRHTVLWIGGSKAVLHHVVTNGPVAPTPTAPLLRAFIRDAAGARHPVAGAIPYSTPAIEFEFAQPDFGRRAQLRLETRIDGIDSNWVPATKESSRELTAVRDGQYTFAVRTVAETGRVSAPTVFSFEVAPPWWRTRTAYWLEALALGLLIYGGVQWRVRALRRHNQQLEAKVKERTEELAEASAAKTQFVANMSHDIRNPLNGIVGLTLALEDTPLDGQQRELVATLRECTTYLSSLVDDVLDFASIEAGRIEVRAAPFVPAELLNSVVTTLKAESSARGAFITIESDPDVPPVLSGDAGRIQQILVNYVSNALKYAGGHIRLCAAVSPRAPGEVEFAVADEGQGISQQEQATLFTKFSRLAGARRSQIPGTGLGLASCRLLADVMGGSVGVESQPGHGSRFYLRLPLVVASEPVAARDDLKLPPTSVLLVEDTDYNALAAKAVLAKLGLPCDRASSGAEALQLFAQKRHAIVLLDRNLPDMDGTEVARRLREIENDGVHAVLLAVTAYCTAEDRKICLDSGMDAFVGKPLTPEKLRKVLLGAADQLLGAGGIAAPTQELAPPTPMAMPTKLDTALLEYLAEGSSGGVAAQAERFIAELQSAYVTLSDQRSGPDLILVAESAHRVLGHARMVGAGRLTDLLIALETAARREDRTTVNATFPAIGPEIEAVTAALRRHPAVQRA